MRLRGRIREINFSIHDATESHFPTTDRSFGDRYAPNDASRADRIWLSLQIRKQGNNHDHQEMLRDVDYQLMRIASCFTCFFVFTILDHALFASNIW